MLPVQGRSGLGRQLATGKSAMKGAGSRGASARSPPALRKTPRATLRWVAMLSKPHHRRQRAACDPCRTRSGKPRLRSRAMAGTSHKGSSPQRPKVSTAKQHYLPRPLRPTSGYVRWFSRWAAARTPPSRKVVPDLAAPPTVSGETQVTSQNKGKPPPATAKPGATKSNLRLSERSVGTWVSRSSRSTFL